jgi:crotonobetainyl-CoA:carnitine CoA-transferase CaiB-like acyl-CoA transferase
LTYPPTAVLGSCRIQQEIEKMDQHALSHIRVLDLTHYIAGPYCTKLMAGYGAEVIKIERVKQGDPMRSVGPFCGGSPGLETSIPFLWLNTGKKSVTLNLKSEHGRSVFLELVRTADLVVENFSPRVMPSLGLDYDTLRDLKPSLVMTSISNFGQTGPYRDYRAEEIVAYAVGGLMYLTGDPEKPPLRAGPSMAQYTAGMTAYIASLMALYRAKLTSEGQHADVSIQESALDNVEICLVEYLHLGKVARRRADEHSLVPWQVYPCRDGYAAVIGGPVRHWLRAAILFEESRLLQEPYRRMAGRMEHREEVRALIQPWLDRHDKTEVYHAGQARRMAFGYLATLPEVLESPQHRAREFFVEIDHPFAGRHQYCGPPFRPSATPWHSDRAPLLGEHNDEVYSTIPGYNRARRATLSEEGVI